jgi:hypothetical protein
VSEAGIQAVPGARALDHPPRGDKPATELSVAVAGLGPINAGVPELLHGNVDFVAARSRWALPSRREGGPR